VAWKKMTLIYKKYKNTIKTKQHSTTPPIMERQGARRHQPRPKRTKAEERAHSPWKNIDGKGKRQNEQWEREGNQKYGEEPMLNQNSKSRLIKPRHHRSKEETNQKNGRSRMRTHQEYTATASNPHMQPNKHQEPSAPPHAG
jgi:hypothetical protein